MDIFMDKIKLPKFKTIITIMLAITFSSLNVFAESQKLTLEDAVNTALKNNRDIKMSILDINKAQAAVDEAYGFALPSLDFTTSFSHMIEKMMMPFPDFGALIKNVALGTLSSKDVNLLDSAKASSLMVPMTTKLQSFSQANNYEAKFQITQILFNSAVLKGISSSGIFLNMSKLGLQSQISKTVLSTKQAYYQALIAQEVYKITESGFNNFAKNVANLKLIYEQGVVSELDYLQLKVQLENFKPKVQQSENNYQMALEALKLTMGIDKATNLEIIGELKSEDFNVPELKSLTDEIYEKNLDLKLLDHKKQVDEAFVDLGRSEYWPTIAAFGNYSFSGSSDKFDFMNYRSSIVGVSLSINLFNGGRSSKKVEQQLIGVEKTNEQLKLAKDGIAINAKSIVMSLDRIKTSLIASQENIKLAERANKIAEIKLKEGAGRQLDYLNTEQSLREANLNYLVAINEYYNSKFALDNLLGKISPDYLKMFENNLRK